MKKSKVTCIFLCFLVESVQMEKDKVFTAKVAEEEEVVLAGFMAVHKELSTAKVAPGRKHMFPGMQKAGLSVK